MRMPCAVRAKLHLEAHACQPHDHVAVPVAPSAALLASALVLGGRGPRDHHLVVDQWERLRRK